MNRWGQLVVSVLAVFLLVVWVRSYLPPSVAVRSLNGKLMLFFSDGSLPFIDPDAPEYRGRDAMMVMILGNPEREFRLLGFTYIHGMWPRPIDPTAGGIMLRGYRLIEIPYWLPTLAIGVPALLSMRRRRRSAKWKLAGRCEDCGFDIRFNNDRCPECGKPIPARATASNGMSATSR
jgi:hypothetical protein